MIDNEPQDQIDINQGQDATFTVVASGVMLIYQWMKDGAAIADTPNTYSGTMSDTLTVLSVDSSDEGEYSVLIANNADILSEPATLTICKLKHVLLSYFVVLPHPNRTRSGCILTTFIPLHTHMCSAHPYNHHSATRHVYHSRQFIHSVCCCFQSISYLPVVCWYISQ